MTTQAIRQNRTVRGLRALRWLIAAGVTTFAGAALAADTSAPNAGSTPSGANAPSMMPERAAAMAAGTQAGAQATKATQAAQGAIGAADAQIVAKLHRANQMEIDAGKMAQDKGSTKAVRDFGAQLVRDHQAADKKVVAYANKANIDPNATTAATATETADEHAAQQKMDSLHQLSGAEFDHQFASMMQEGHAKVITAVTTAQGAVADKKLKSLLGSLLPTLRKHEQTAQNLSAGGPHAEM